MESLAPELLESIFLSACTDGGFTGCALSLVSKRIRAASYSARYFSVALLSQSPTQLHKFLAHLVRERAASPATARPAGTCSTITKRRAQRQCTGGCGRR